MIWITTAEYIWRFAFQRQKSVPKQPNPQAVCVFTVTGSWTRHLCGVFWQNSGWKKKKKKRHLLLQTSLKYLDTFLVDSISWPHRFQTVNHTDDWADYRGQMVLSECSRDAASPQIFCQLWCFWHVTQYSLFFFSFFPLKAPELTSGRKETKCCVYKRFCPLLSHCQHSWVL